jgi:virginiamycin A acetyltransferase
MKNIIFKINPIIKYFQWVFLYFKLKRNNKTLFIGYKSAAYNCSFSNQNKIYDNTILINTNLESYSYIGSNCYIMNTTIGKFCSIAPNCRIGLGIHPTSYISTHPAFFSSKNEWNFNPKLQFKTTEYKPIKIGSDVWIGTNSIILDGVTIGDGAIIGAGSVVTKDVMPYAIVGGNPAKIIKFRFSEEIIRQLLVIKWWNWDDTKIKTSLDFFFDINGFIKNYE